MLIMFSTNTFDVDDKRVLIVNSINSFNVFFQFSTTFLSDMDFHVGIH